MESENRKAKLYSGLPVASAFIQQYVFPLIGADIAIGRVCELESLLAKTMEVAYAEGRLAGTERAANVIDGALKESK